MRVNIVCSKWGTRYGPHFVNKLKNMARRHTDAKHDFHFYCYTDDAEGLDDDIKVIPFPDIDTIHPKYWFGSDDSPFIASHLERKSFESLSLTSPLATATRMGLVLLQLGAAKPSAMICSIISSGTGVDRKSLVEYLDDTND